MQTNEELNLALNDANKVAALINLFVKERFRARQVRSKGFSIVQMLLMAYLAYGAGMVELQLSRKTRRKLTNLLRCSNLVRGATDKQAMSAAAALIGNSPNAVNDFFLAEQASELRAFDTNFKTIHPILGILRNALFNLMEVQGVNIPDIEKDYVPSLACSRLTIENIDMTNVALLCGVGGKDLQVFKKLVKQEHTRQIDYMALMEF